MKMPETERLSPLPVEEWDDAAKAALPAFVRRPELYFGPEARPMPKVLGLLARHVPLGEGWLAFNDVLAKKTTVDVRLRELIILRVAWLTRSAYEWSQHTRIGHQAGLTVEQLHAIPQGPAADLWSPVERAVLSATDELIDRQVVEEDTWARLSQHFDGSQLLEVLFIAGTYICFAMVCNSAGLSPDPATERIDAPQLPRVPR
jgi:4-carboxymuconolactone decarboxylase